MVNMSVATNKIEAPCELQLEVWKRPLAEIARDYNIPLRSLMIRIRAEDIGLPPPEYWDLLASGFTRIQVLRKIGWTAPMIRKINEILRNAKEEIKRAKKKARKSKRI